MTVYGWTAIAHKTLAERLELATHQRQVRAIVATRSFAAASRASIAAGLGKMSKDYSSPTGNREELDRALSSPGVVFVRALDGYGSRGAFMALSPKRSYYPVP